MTRDEPTRCRTCGAKIEFRQSPNGRPMPVQRVRSLYTVVGTRLEKLAVPDTNSSGTGIAGEGLWVSHFETCPQASAHSKGRRS